MGFNKMTVKNHKTSFNMDEELMDLLEECLNKVQSESKIKISKSDLLRTLLRQGLMELKTGEINKVQLLFK